MFVSSFFKNNEISGLRDNIKKRGSWDNRSTYIYDYATNPK